MPAEGRKAGDPLQASLFAASASGDVARVSALVGSLPKEQRAALLCSRDDVGDTPLHAAVRAGHPAVVRRLLLAGAEVNLLDGSLAGPLDLACGLMTRDKDTLEVVQILLTAGAVACGTRRQGHGRVPDAQRDARHKDARRWVRHAQWEKVHNTVILALMYLVAVLGIVLVRTYLSVRL